MEKEKIILGCHLKSYIGDILKIVKEHRTLIQYLGQSNQLEKWKEFEKGFKVEIR